MRKLLLGLLGCLLVWPALGADLGLTTMGVSFSGGAAPFSGVCDITACTVAYGVRQLAAAYAGNAVQIRRASDNTTQNIGFVSHNFDAASFTTFCSATTCFVATWYDQSGNAANVSQATAANQPQLLLNQQNSQPALTFNGSAQMLAGNLSSTISAMSLSTVAEYTDANAIYTLFEVVPSGGGLFSGESFFSQTTTGFVARRFNFNDAILTAISGPTNGTFFQAFGNYNGTLSQINMNGVGGVDSTATQAQPNLLSMAIGESQDEVHFPLLGSISEFLIFSPVLSSGNQTSVRSNQKTYWNTP